MTQSQAVKLTIEKLGGMATLGQLNQETLKIMECKWNTKTPFASIRRIVQQDREIYKIKPGLYGLLSLKSQNEAKGIMIETPENREDKSIIEFNHTYYQGLLLLIGKMKSLLTFCPQQDKNKIFIERPLEQLRTLDKLPDYSYPKFVKRSATVDVVWFNDRQMPHSFFEVETSTDIQNSLLKFSDLQDFYAGMYVVASEHRQKEYLKKINYSAFSDLTSKNRVTFLSFDSLVKQYEYYSERSSQLIQL